MSDWVQIALGVAGSFAIFLAPHLGFHYVQERRRRKAWNAKMDAVQAAIKASTEEPR